MASANRKRRANLAVPRSRQIGRKTGSPRTHCYPRVGRPRPVPGALAPSQPAAVGGWDLIGIVRASTAPMYADADTALLEIVANAQSSLAQGRGLRGICGDLLSALLDLTGAGYGVVGAVDPSQPDQITVLAAERRRAGASKAVGRSGSVPPIRRDGPVGLALTARSPRIQNRPGGLTLADLSGPGCSPLRGLDRGPTGGDPLRQPGRVRAVRPGRPGRRLPPRPAAEPYGPLAMALAAFAEDHSPPPPSMEVSLTRPGEEPAPIELRMRVAGAPGARPPAPRRGGAPPR